MTLYSVLLAVVLGAPTFGPVEFRGHLMDSALSETSGLCASNIHPERLWLINDSGSGAELLAIDQRGHLEGRIAVEGVINRDWEAISCFVEEGTPRIAIADVGDNEKIRDNVSILVLDEPPDLSSPLVKAGKVITVQLDGGPSDTEAMAIVDAGRTALLITKRNVPPEVHTVDLHAGTSVASQRVGAVFGIPRPSDFDRRENPVNGQWTGQPTDAALLPDDAGIALLTYTDAYVYLRQPGENWEQTLGRAPIVLDLPPILQAEAFTFTRDGKSLIITSEKWPAPLLALSYLGLNDQL